MSSKPDDFGFQPRGNRQQEADEFGFMPRGQAPPKEGAIKSALRTAYQPLGGIAQRFTYPMNLLEIGGTGYALDPEEIEHLRKIYEREGIPFDEEEYRRQVEQASQYFPTQGNIEREVEERTGIPLQAKTGMQKAIRMGSTAASFQPGSLTQKAAAGIGAPLAKEGLEAIGVPEIFAEPLGYGAGAAAGAATPKASIQAAKKPSGMTTRQFEKLSKSTKVSPGRFGKINEALEKDFRNISEDILTESPTYEEIKADPAGYAKKLNQGFEEVEKLAEEMPQKVHRRQIGAFMKRRLNTSTREMKGITPTEAEETFRKEFGTYIKKVAEGPEKFSIPKTVEQFRKNNKELADYFEPGKSKGFNKGKRDALLEYNRAIEEFYDTAFPNSEFSKLFKNQNQKWSQLKDFEFVEEQIGKIFEGEKINFKDITKILDKNNANYRRSFQRIMGKEGFKDFEGLVEDFVSVKQPYSLLKKAEAAGFGDLAKLAGKFLINPTFGKLSAGKQLAEDAMKMLLDKPQFTFVWKQAIDNLKKGNYAEAEQGFNRLNEEAQATAEKIKPLAEKAKTLPEGFSPEIAEKVFEENPKYFKTPGLGTSKE